MKTPEEALGFSLNTQDNNLIKPDYYSNQGMDLFDRFEGGLMPVCQVQGFYIGNIIKYMTRYQSKNGVEDLEKASTYLQQLIDFEKRLDSSKPVYHGQAGDIGDN